MTLTLDPSAITSPGLMLSERSRWEAEITGVVERELEAFLDQLTIDIAAQRAVSPPMVQERYDRALVQISDTLSDDPDVAAQVVAQLQFSELPNQIYSTAAVVVGGLLVLGLSSRRFRQALASALRFDSPSLEAGSGDPSKNTPLDIAALIPGISAAGPSWKSTATAAARTASTAALNEGLYQQLQRSSYTHKKWVTRRDFRVRETHNAADGQVVPKASLFQVGSAALLYPGHGTFPAEEIINCRCVMIGVNADGTV